MTAEYFDVVIVGAGLSGIGAARHLQDECSDKSFVILEGRESLGGTWDLFRFPGIRSDSDMHTLGYDFKPWQSNQSIADGASILGYLAEAAAETGVDRHIRYRHRVASAHWSDADATWVVEVAIGDDAETTRIRCNVLLICAGYYSYEAGHTPEFDGIADFAGRVVHPQDWPDDLDYTGKRVVVVGSGATAVTLVPAMADDAEHVTMLQRSPTWMVSMPAMDRVARILRLLLPERWAHGIIRWKNIRLQHTVYNRTRTRPDKVRKVLLKMLRKEMGADYDIDTHLTPRYDPWDQRLCLVPDSDFFESVRSGRASIVTDQIDSFTENSIRLKSGQELEADIVVTATGLAIVSLGDIRLTVNGEPVNVPDTFSYLGMMYSDVPNLISTFGYVNASWTLRADLIAHFACRMINHMDASGSRRAVPRLRPADRDMEERPWIAGFSSGYIQRAIHLMPRQGDRAPWLNTQDFIADRKLLRDRPLEDGVLQFDDPAAASSRQDELRIDAA